MKKYFIIFIFCISCIEPYDLEVKGTRKALVIEAVVTNLPGEQYVRLQYSYPLDGFTPEFVSGASVVLTDDLNNTEVFQEVGGGLYQPASSFAGITGRKYHLIIDTPDGKRYQSQEEKLLEPAAVSDLYGEFLLLRSESSDGFDRGIQFLVDVDPADEESHNFRFQYEADYEIEVPFVSIFEFNPSTRTIDQREQSIKLCYINEPSNELLIATTSGQVSNELREFPIVFVLEDEPHLLGKYSLTLKHYRISSAAYQYYSDLKENNESAGSFFDRQKGSLIGNIQNVNDPSEPVLGYFEVAGASVTYETFEAGAWGDDGFQAEGIFDYCYNLFDTVRTEDIISGTFDFNNRLIYNFLEGDALVPGTPYNVETLLLPERCIDCRVYGTLIKPEFWD